jgi:isoamylase
VHSHSLATNITCRTANLRVYLILNAYWESLEFELPSLGDHDVWHRWIDTSLDSPDDIVEWWAAPNVTSRAYLAGPRSVVGLFAWLSDRPKL